MKKSKTSKRTAGKRLRAAAGSTLLLPMSKRDALCIWAAIVLREPEPLTRLLKKILEPVVIPELKKERMSNDQALRRR